MSLLSPLLCLPPLLCSLTHTHLCLPEGQMVRVEEGPSCEADDGRSANTLSSEEHLSSTEYILIHFKLYDVISGSHFPF